MAQSVKDNRIVLSEEDSRKKFFEGATAIYESVTKTFGPKGMNVAVEKPFGRPIVTRDGVTVARDTYFSDRAKNIGAQLILEASETTNRIAGDGTTGTVAFSYHLFENGLKAIASGVHPMAVKQTLLDDQEKMLTRLNDIATPVKKGQLLDVATVSSGDPLLGQLISEAVEKVGSDGGILTEKAPIDDVEREYVDGYYLQSGFQALQVGKKELIDPAVVVTTRRLSSNADAVEIMTKVAQAKGLQPGNVLRLLIVGNVEDAAYNTICENINRGTVDAIIIKTPPMFGDMGKQLLEDVALYAGCQPLTDLTSLTAFGSHNVGSVDKVITNKSESTLFANNETEAVKTRVQEIKDQLEEEVVDAIADKLKDRIAKLEGKIALFRIGGATDTSKEEKEFRIEDAINATRAAYTHGVVPGGCTTLLDLSKLDVSNITKDALQATFKRLLINANLPAEIKLQEALNAPFGHGFNLRGDGEIVDMTKAGVLDPVLVIQQVVRNATQVVADGLSVGTTLIYEDRTEE